MHQYLLSLTFFISFISLAIFLSFVMHRRRVMLRERIFFNTGATIRWSEYLSKKGIVVLSAISILCLSCVVDIVFINMR